MTRNDQNLWDNSIDLFSCGTESDAILEFVGDTFANILNLSDPDPRRQRSLIIPPFSRDCMPKEMLEFVNEMGKPQSGQGKRLDSPSRIRGMYLLLKSAQCRLCARGNDHETMVRKYLKSKTSFRLFGSSLTKAEEKQRKKFSGFGFLETAVGARAFVKQTLLQTLGPDVIANFDAPDSISRVRDSAHSIADIFGRVTDEPIVLDFYTSFFDFTYHSDGQIGKTLKAVSKYYKELQTEEDVMVDEGEDRLSLSRALESYMSRLGG